MPKKRNSSITNDEVHPSRKSPKVSKDSCAPSVERSVETKTDSDSEKRILRTRLKREKKPKRDQTEKEAVGRASTPRSIKKETKNAKDQPSQSPSSPTPPPLPPPTNGKKKLFSFGPVCMLSLHDDDREKRRKKKRESSASASRNSLTNSEFSFAMTPGTPASGPSPMGQLLSSPLLSALGNLGISSPAAPATASIGQSPALGQSLDFTGDMNFNPSRAKTFTKNDNSNSMVEISDEEGQTRKQEFRGGIEVVSISDSDDESQPHLRRSSLSSSPRRNDSSFPLLPQPQSAEGPDPHSVALVLHENSNQVLNERSQVEDVSPPAVVLFLQKSGTGSSDSEDVLSGRRDDEEKVRRNSED